MIVGYVINLGFALNLLKGDLKCDPGRKGPPCLVHADCAGLPGCVRCAKSKHCTDVSVSNSASGDHGGRHSRKGKHESGNNAQDKKEESTRRAFMHYPPTPDPFRSVMRLSGPELKEVCDSEPDVC